MSSQKKSHNSEMSIIPSFPSWLRDEGRSLSLMMGGDLLVHLYLKSPVFFQIQPGNPEQPVWTDECAIASACTLESSSPCFHVICLLTYLLMALRRWKQSLSPVTFHPRKPSRELAVYSGQGQEKPSASHLSFWIGPLGLPFSWSFGASFEWEPHNCFALLTHPVSNVSKVEPQAME